MSTLRVDIVYRPLRIGWAIRAGDFKAFRQAVRYSYALWGGRFNPIIIVDREDATQLVDLFRVDLLVPIGDDQLVKDFPAKYPHLINPFFHDSVFMKGDSYSDPWSQAIDIHNQLAYLFDKAEWQEIKKREVRLYDWHPDDPIADVLLVQLGGYPSVEDVGRDYRHLVRDMADAPELTLLPTYPLPSTICDHPGIAYFSRHGIERHYSIRANLSSPGFFIGSVANLDDIVSHWNLRACDIPLWFVDPAHIERYSELIPKWESIINRMLAGGRHEIDRLLGIWTMREDTDEVRNLFASAKTLVCPVIDGTWNGLNVLAPMMYFGEASALGVLSVDGEGRKVSFALPEKPFSTTNYFYQQHLVASVSLRLFRDLQNTFDVPYLPELNEFCARAMKVQYNELRLEPDRIGLVIRATEHDSYLYALPVADFVERLFDLGGLSARLSSAGLLTRQLLAQLGGLQGARVFKVPGVRRLLRKFGPSTPFTKNTALQLIGSRDPDNPRARFSDHEDLYIEPRPHGTKLTPGDVFGHMVAKRLFRVGASLQCPNCHMSSWTALDSLRQEHTCELCGHHFDATRQLTASNELHFRRSGVLGAERNAQGAVPVTLTLQQLETSLSSLNSNIYSSSLDLKSKPTTDPLECEIDFVCIIPRTGQHKTAVLIGECKDHLPITSGNIEALRAVGERLPQARLEVFFVLSQLAPFSPAQIALARALNDEYRRRAILLTDRELEPYFIYQRVKDELGFDFHGGSPEEMAKATHEMYFK